MLPYLGFPMILQSMKAAFATVNDGDNLATVLAQLEKLTYLTAVAKEALRLAYGVSL